MLRMSAPRLAPTRRRTALAVAGVGVALAASACTVPSSQLGSTGPLTGPYTKTVFGVDVASYQHPNGAAINWSSVKASGAAFAFVKVSEGATYTNPYAAGDLRSARSAGLRASGYHFARPRLPLSTATADAKRFAAQVGNAKLAGNLPPVLDIEANGGLSAANVTAWTKTFLSSLEAASGRTPMIYSGGWFWRGYMGNPSGFSRYPVWISDYNPAKTGPALFGDFTYSSFWQYTDAARVSGISGATDGNWFHGTRSQLDTLSYVGAPVVSAPAPPPPATTTPAKPAASLGLTAGANAVKPGAPLWLFGKLVDTRTNTPLTGKSFTVWRKVTGQTAFTKIGTAKTSSNGTAFWATSQTKTSSYQFRVDAGAAGTGFPAVASPVRTVTS